MCLKLSSQEHTELCINNIRHLNTTVLAACFLSQMKRVMHLKMESEEENDTVMKLLLQQQK